MSSSSASERGQVVWRPAFDPKSYFATAAQKQTNLQGNDEHSYATMAPSHSAKDKQAVTHASHLSGDLHSPRDAAIEKSGVLSPSQHSTKDFESRSACDASSASVTSLLKNDTLYARERGSRKKVALDLTKTNFYHQKPPILSPKPNILPKPKVLSGFTPSAVNDSNQSRNQQSSSVKQVSSTKFSFNNSYQTEIRDYQNKPSENRFRGRSQSVEDDSAVEGKEILQTNVVAGHVPRKPVKRSQTLPRLSKNPEDVRRFGMESAQSFSKPNTENLSFRSPPKVPVKPKPKPYNDYTNNSKTRPVVNGNFEGSINNGEFQDTSLAPFSEMRSKFEDMKIKFKKPMPDPELQPPVASKSYNRGSATTTTTAHELFKDILEMKTLGSFEEDVLSHESKDMNHIGNDSLPNTGASHASQSHYHADDRSFEKRDVEPVVVSQNLQNLKSKYEKEFDTKVINSLISPKEKKSLFDSDVASRNRNVNEDHSWSKSKKIPYNPADVPAPTQSQGDDLQHIDFMDLPPPPEFPPISEVALASKGTHRDVVKASALRSTRNLPNQDIAGFRQTDEQSIASGSAKASTRTNNAMNSKIASDLSNNNRKSDKNSQLLGKPVKAENPSNKVDSCEPDREEALLRQSPSSFDKSLSSNGKAVKQKVATAFDDAKFPLTSSTRTFDDEILYYDNMDIMEKVRQKREQDENRMKKFSQNEKKITDFPMRSKSRETHESRGLQAPVLSPKSTNKGASASASKANELADLSPSGNLTEVRSTVGTLEKEFLKLKANLDEKKMPSAPPKLPPKQLKFNRKQAIETADQQPSPSSESRPQFPNETDKTSNAPSLRIHIVASPSQITTSPHIATPIPNQNSPAFSALSQSQEHSSGRQQQQQQPQVLTQQLTPEDARARQLVDEPLAPIIEEDSTYGDSSSCASSVAGDDPSVFAETISVHSAEAFVTNNVQFSLKQPQFSDGTESESTFADRDAFHSSESTNDESDTSSVQWQENPLRSNQQSANTSHPRTFADNVASLTGSSVQAKSIINDPRNVRSACNKRDERKSLESSGSEAKSVDRTDLASNKSTDDVIEDVEPYGMVDLSKLQPTFSEIQTSGSRPISKSSEEELTPTSIMNSVHQFNADNPKSPTKSGNFSFDEATDMPNFPLKVDVNKKRPTSVSKVQPAKHQRSKSDASHRFIEEEQPGYDNLENYGGPAREAAEKKKKLREASLPAKYTQSSAPSHNASTSQRKTLERGDSRDSLSSEPGLSKQVPGSRASFPLPATESRLSRHSSAVRAVDRHSGNLKRAKESGALGSFTKSPISHKFEKHQKPSPLQQASTLPRTHSEHSDGDAKNNRSFKMIQNSFEIREKQQSGNIVAANSSKFESQILQNGSKKIEGLSSPKLSIDYDERLDDGIVNPYEEVPFMLPPGGHQTMTSLPASAEETQAKSRVKEILENIKPPESQYRPKPPVPRYPVDYDNFYLGKSDSTAQAKPEPNESSELNAKPKIRSISGTTSSSSPLSSPAPDDKSFRYSDATTTPGSTPALARAASSRSSRYNTVSQEATSQNPDESNDDDVSHIVPDGGPRSLGSQLRYLLGGGQDSKHVSPSIRRKRSLLKRSKSPGGSRKSNSPSKTSLAHSRDASNEEINAIKTESGKSSETESRDLIPPRRSASQRLVDRRGRSAPLKAKTSEEESSQPSEHRRKDKLRMSSRWRRSKSQDRGESPTRSKSKERKIFGRRSKSQERPEGKGVESNDIDTGDEERSGRRFLRRSRSSSRKRDKRGRSSERSEDGNSSSGRGRNPVSFFKRLLRTKKSDNEIQIIHSTFEKGDANDATEALSTILAYKGEEEVEKENWNPPRPNPPQQRTNKTNERKSKPSLAAKPNKVLKSPPSHRAKKFSSASTAPKNRSELSTGSSSEGIDKRRQERTKILDPHGVVDSNRSHMTPPQKPFRSSSRKSSFSIPSSDSEPLSKNENKRKLFGTSAHDDDLHSNRTPLPLKAGGLRRNLLNRDYDSDTATSVLASDADSSAGPHSDFDGNNPATLRSALKPKNDDHQFNEKSSGVPKRPVRIIPPHRSKSDPSIFPGPSTSGNTEDAHVNTYYNIEDDVTNQPSPCTQEKKRPNKPASHRRRNQKQTRRQTAPVDLAYEAHQRQKYKTLVSLNSQTLRKVTEKWLSEWRNQLPVGGFLITSWSDVALSSHRPMCMIANSVVYSAVSTGSKQFHLACQLYDNSDVDDRMVRKLDNCSSLAAHPNTCGVCSHFNCRVPRSLLDPSSGGGAADAVCVVLTTRPSQSLQDFLDTVACQQEPAEFHKHVLINILQLLQGIKHLQSSGFDFPHVSAEHLVITEDRGFLQILPHLHYSEQRGRRMRNMERMDSYQSSDFDSIPPHHSITQQVGHLMRNLLHNSNLASAVERGDRAAGRRSAASTSAHVVPGTKYSSAIKHIIKHLNTSPSLDVHEAAQIIQCALWGPDDLEDVGVDDVSPYAALELWIEMEQAKLVNSLAVLASTDRLVPLSFLKHQYFATVAPQSLFNGLKVLQRI